MQVELDAFSGRPNPRWELTAPQAADLLTQLGALRPGDRGQFVSDGLGYRGFIIRPNDGSLAGYDEIRVYRGSVLARRGEHTDVFRDSERHLEIQLLHSGRNHLDESMLHYFQTEIRQ